VSIAGVASAGASEVAVAVGVAASSAAQPDRTSADAEAIAPKANRLRLDDFNGAPFSVCIYKKCLPSLVSKLSSRPIAKVVKLASACINNILITRPVNVRF
jgi:hypothetical protein